jgi:outer membrane murein-binding lipoprotein Lpp
MKNKKKVLAVAAGILAALLLAGCAGGGAKTTDGTEASAATTNQEDETMTSNSTKPGKKAGVWWMLDEESTEWYEYGTLDSVSYTPAEAGKPTEEIKWAFFQIYEHMANGGYLFDFDKNMVYAASEVIYVSEDSIRMVTDEEEEKVRELISAAGMDAWSGEYNYPHKDSGWYITLLYEDGSQVRAGGSRSVNGKDTPEEYSTFLDGIEALMDEIREHNKTSESE